MNNLSSIYLLPFPPSSYDPLQDNFEDDGIKQMIKRRRFDQNICEVATSIVKSNRADFLYQIDLPEDFSPITPKEPHAAIQPRPAEELKLTPKFDLNHPTPPPLKYSPLPPEIRSRIWPKTFSPQMPPMSSRKSRV